MKLKGLLLIIIVLLFAACGRQHDAESIVKDFMNENLSDASTLSGVEFAKIDSTRRLNDSIIYRMREIVDYSDKYKRNIKYSDYKAGENLIILRVAYKLEGDNYSDTYYLDNDFTHVVAVKIN